MRYRRVSYSYTEVVRTTAPRALGALWKFGAWGTVADTCWHPPTDVYETSDRLVVKVELAGLSEDEIEVALYADTLVVQGVRHPDPLPGEARYHSAELRYGSFRVEVPLPCVVEPDEVEARYDRGVLAVRLPRCRTGDL